MSDQQIEDDTTRATAHLPGLEIEIVHRRSPGAEVEQISIYLQAVPSFEAFGRFLGTVPAINQGRRSNVQMNSQLSMLAPR